MGTGNKTIKCIFNHNFLYNQERTQIIEEVINNEKTIEMEAEALAEGTIKRLEELIEMENDFFK